MFVFGIVNNLRNKANADIQSTLSRSAKNVCEKSYGQEIVD